jgi:hypothetical protein
VYPAIVAAFVLVLPVVSIVVETLSGGGGAPGAWVIGRWFVFWGVGVRLALAGLRQVTQPRYTAETILGLESEESHIVVRELGIANMAIGAVGLGSLVARGWVLPAAIAGTIFYGLAGVNHVAHGVRTRNESIAMVSDLFIAAVLLAFCLRITTA